MEQYHPSKHAEINKAKLKFDIWRCSKKTPSEKIPSSLWEIVGELLQKYPVSIVFRQLNLNKDQGMKYFSKQWLTKNIVKPTSIVEVKNPHSDLNPLTTEQKEDFQILIQHTKGHQLSVKADKELTFNAITAFIGSS